MLSNEHRCRICNGEKVRNAYSWVCRPCQRKRVRDWKRRNPRKRYGVTYAELVSQYGDRCNICGSTDSRNPTQGRLCIDHDHRTNQVRGLLCHHCNAGIGHFSDDPSLLQTAINYLGRLG